MTNTTDAKRVSRAGQVAIQADHATLNFKRILGHPREVVWEALTDPDQLKR